MERIRSYKDLRVYQTAMDSAMQVFELTKGFPPEEKFAMVDQVRRSSRSVCTNLAEGWRKRRYAAHFTSKLSDAETEAEETRVWLEFASRCGYCALPNLGVLRKDNAQSGGERERGGGPPLSVGPAGRAGRLRISLQAPAPSPRTKRCGRIGKPKFRNAEYLARGIVDQLDDQYDKILAQLVLMISNPKQWTIPPARPSAPSLRRRVLSS